MDSDEVWRQQIISTALQDMLRQRAHAIAGRIRDSAESRNGTCARRYLGQD